MSNILLVILMAITNTVFLAEWASNPARRIVAKLTYLVDGVSTTSYASPVGFRTLPGDTPSDELIYGNLLAAQEAGPSDLVMGLSGYNPWMTEGGGNSGVDLIFANEDADRDAWSDYDWRDQVQELYLGFDGDAFTDFVRVWARYSGDMRADEDRLYLPLVNGDYRISVPYQTTRFDGEANDGINGRPVPKAIGNPYYVPPSFITPNDLEYQFHENANASVDTVFGSGFEFQEFGVVGTSITFTNPFGASWTGSGTNDVTYTSSAALIEGFIYSDTAISSASSTYFEVLWVSVTGSNIMSLALTDQSSGSSPYSGDYARFTINSNSMSAIGSEGDSFRGVGNNVTDRFGFLIKKGRVYLYINGELQGSLVLAGSTSSYYFVISVQGTATNDAARFQLLGDANQWLYPPTNIEDSGAFGRQGEYIVTSPTFGLLRNPTTNKITAHVAAHSPQGFETWSVTESATIGGKGKAKTITATSGTKSGHIVPAPRSFGDLVFEVQCDSVDNSGGPEIGFAHCNATDTLATLTSTDRDRKALWADGGAFRLNGTTAATVGGGFATNSVAGFRIDRDNNAIYLYENGVELGGGSSPFTLTDVIRDDAKGPFSGSNYYTADTAAFSDSDLLTIALRWVHDGTTANQVFFQLDGNRAILTINNNLLTILVADSGGTTIALYQSSALSAGEHSAIIALDAATPSCSIYVDDSEDTNAVTTTGGTIGWRASVDSIGANAAGGSPLLGDLQLLGVCSGVEVDLSVAANRRRFFREDGYPSELAGYNGRGAFGQVPEFWIVNGDATLNRGSKRAFAETGTVPDTDIAGDRYAPIVPVVITDTIGDRFTVETIAEDMTHYSSYGGATAWGHVWALPECINDLAGANDDLENNFLAVSNSGFAPALAYYNERPRGTPDVIDWMTRSCGFFRYWDRDNEIRVADMADPETLTSVGTINRDNHVGIDIITRELDRASFLRANIAGWRIWAPHGSNEIVGAVDAATSELLQEDFGIVTAGNTTGLATPYTHAADAPDLQTLLNDGEPLDATVGRSTEALARRALGLYCCNRYLYRIPNVQRLALVSNDIEPGDAITLVINRWGLEAGKKLLVLDIQARDYDASFDLVAWG